MWSVGSEHIAQRRRCSEESGEALERFVNSPREKGKLALDYWDRVRRTDDVELGRAGNVHQNGLESKKSFFSRGFSVHDHRERDWFKGLLG